MTARVAGKRDAFPSTQRTWLADRLQEGDAGLAHARRHVMDVYAHPLGVYYKGSSFRWLGEPDDMVRGYFADRLSREEYLEKWMHSGRQLRFWLIVGFKHYLLESARAKAKAERASLGQLESETSGDAGPEEAFHRESARAIASEAFRLASSACSEAGQGEHWDVFMRHHLEGRGYAAVAAEMGMTPERAAVMARTASNKYRAALRELVAWPGASRDEVDDEIQSLLEAIG